MSSPEHKQKIWKLIRDIKTCMLTTRHGDELRSRPMVLVQDEYDGTLWFYTDLDSEKVFELEQDHDVCVSFADPEHHVYVSLTGLGRAIRDQERIDQYWNSAIAAWFPEGKDSPNVGMLEVKVQKGEHWDSDSSKMVKSIKTTKARIEGEQPDLGEHEKFGVGE
ncbi:pyridoxamine 5'-phosphate oxidase family protein [Marinobacter persicus]|uniref:General stress protein 26 n=1 Tax=Marinobacter persicus TaxID=930118 RepID=A0A2S6G330_9GAMM|nr:pyridoxamine 5'-phosphate oxidase family protein [Marinobacter persicus]PPK50212.1 general stress protein 26 [Marinobacter persicus]PPK52669.1 general stress protein 26 [Marinobacter persicus]PPK56683.1 general stress protein 26 [Marinobacter persicus]